MLLFKSGYHCGKFFIINRVISLSHIKQVWEKSVRPSVTIIAFYWQYSFNCNATCIHIQSYFLISIWIGKKQCFCEFIFQHAKHILFFFTPFEWGDFFWLNCLMTLLLGTRDWPLNNSICILSLHLYTILE